MTTAKTYYRLALLVAAGTAFVVLFGIAALGIIGDGGPEDLLYAAAVAIAVVGSLVARFRAGGMALALGTAAVAVVVAGVVAFAAGFTEGASAGDVVMLTAGLAAGFGLSAWLFHRASASGAELVA
jgi:hypothetical protein